MVQKILKTPLRNIKMAPYYIFVTYFGDQKPNIEYNLFRYFLSKVAIQKEIPPGSFEVVKIKK